MQSQPALQAERKAWGVSPRKRKGTSFKPVKRATALTHEAFARFPRARKTNCDLYLGLTPQALCLRLQCRLRRGQDVVAQQIICKRCVL